MNTQLPTYETQFNKITEAYIKGNIKPWDDDFCFCGTLADGDDWTFLNQKSLSYTPVEFGKMEKALFSPFPEIKWSYNGRQKRSCPLVKITQAKDFEEKLFNGMCAALEVLKQIHIEHGEVIDNPQPFVKRTLTPQTV